MEKELFCLGQHEFFLQAFRGYLSTYLSDLPKPIVALGFHKTRMISIKLTFPAASEKVVTQNIGKIARVLNSIGAFDYLLIRMGNDFRAYSFEDMAAVDPSVSHVIEGVNDRLSKREQTRGLP